MIQKVQEYIQKYHMIDPGDQVIAGISGGADSVCLLFQLLDLKNSMPFSIYVVHVNHGMREEAKEDSDYVKTICEQHQIPFFLVEEDVNKIALTKHLSCEEAGRMVRYEAFDRINQQYCKGNGKIAVAHNKNDQAETVLFQLFRGSGIRGMSGIRPVRDQIIRPLLCLERNEIEEFLETSQIPFCVDKTNAEDLYTRNRIRHHILPFGEEQVSKQVISHIFDAAQLLSETEEYLEEMTEVAFAECAKLVFLEENAINLENKVSKIESIQIEKDAFCKQPVILQKYLLRLCFFKLVCTKKDITSFHVEDVKNLFEKQVGKQIILPYGLTATRSYDGIVIKIEDNIEKSEIRKKIISLFVSEKRLEKESIFLDGLGQVEMELFQNVNYDFYEKVTKKPEEESEKKLENTYTKWLDYDKMSESVVLRTREIGDYFIINEEHKTKLLKEYFINEKIPKDERDQIYLMADGNHIIWVIGYRMSQFYKVSESTKNILKVHIIRRK